MQKKIQIGSVIDEKVEDGLGGIAEIYHDMAFVFCFREMLCDKAFAHASRAVYQQGGSTSAFPFPVDECIIYFSFQHFKFTPRCHSICH